PDGRTSRKRARRNQSDAGGESRDGHHRGHHRSLEMRWVVLIQFTPRVGPQPSPVIMRTASSATKKSAAIAGRPANAWGVIFRSRTPMATGVASDVTVPTIRCAPGYYRSA